LPPPVKGVAAHWRLDDGSGNEVLDSSGNKYDGKLEYQVGTDFAWSASGIIDGSASFNGNGAHITTSFKPVIDPKGSFTISLWVRTNNQGTNGIIGFRNKTDGAMELYLEGMQGLRFELKDRNGYKTSLTSTESVSGGKWNHLAVVRNGTKGQVLLYVNGKWSKTVTDITKDKANAALQRPIFLGAVNSENGNALHSYTGDLDDVRIYMKALDAIEMGGLYREGFWAMSMGDKGEDRISAVAVDTKGDTYVTGWFKGKSATFAGQQIKADGDTNLVVARLKSGGKPVWITELGGANTQIKGTAIAVDNSGKTYVAGEIAGTGTAKDSNGKIALKSKGLEDAFLIKLDDKGNPEWGTVYGTDKKDYATGVAVNAKADKIFMVGASTLSNANKTNGFIVRSDGGAAFNITKMVGVSTHDDALHAVAVTSKDEAWATGRLSSTVNIAGTNLIPNGGKGAADIVLVRMDPTGAIDKALIAGGSGTDEGNAVAIRNNGLPVIVGSFSGSATFVTASGPEPLTAPASSGNCAFVAEVDSTYKWAKVAGPGKGSGSSGTSRGLAVALDYTGDLYVAGEFKGTLDFGGPKVGPTTTTSAFMTRFNKQDKPMWAESAGGDGNDSAYGVGVGPSSEGNQPLILVGEFGKGKTGAKGTFGTHTFNSLGSGDGFVWRVDR